MTRPDKDWKEQRDRLLADTLAFVQQVAVEQPLPSVPAKTMAAQPVEPAPVVSGPSPRLPIQQTSMRDDIRAHVDLFRARQHAFQVARDAHYDDAIRRVRAVTKNWS
ncbi:MAG: hypothetical protein ABWY18_05940 [Tardiphaga sp.]